MTEGSSGAVMMLEVREAKNARSTDSNRRDAALREARLLLEGAGPSWSPDPGPGLGGRFSLDDPGEAFGLLHRLRTELRSDPAAFALEIRAALGAGVDAAAAAEVARGVLAKKRRLLTRAHTGNADSDVVLGALCRAMDSLVAGWTDPQWQAVHRRDQGRTLQEIGQELGIAYQNVSKRLIAARYSLYREILGAASQVFSKATPTRS